MIYASFCQKSTKAPIFYFHCTDRVGKINSCGQETHRPDARGHRPQTLFLSHLTDLPGLGHRYIVVHHKCHPDQMGAPGIQDFLSHLAIQDHIGASTQNRTLSAILFLCREVLHGGVQYRGISGALPPFVKDRACYKSQNCCLMPAGTSGIKGPCPMVFLFFPADAWREEQRANRTC
jgi:hypothetical protein